MKKQVEDGAELMEGHASEAVVDSVFKNSFNKSDEDEEGPSCQPKACSVWFEKIHAPFLWSSLVGTTRDLACSVCLLGVRHREVHIQGSVGCDGHIVY